LASTGILLVVGAIVMAADALGAFSDAEEEAEDKIKKTNEALKERKEALDDTMKSNQSYIDRSVELVKVEEEIKTLGLDKEKNYKRINELQKQAIDLQLRQLGAELESKKGLLTTDEEFKLKEKIYRLQQDRSRLEIQFSMDEKSRSEKRIQDAEKEKKAAEEKKKELEKLRGYEAEYEEFLKKQRENNAKEFQDRTNKEYEDSIKSSDGYYNHLIIGAQISNQETEKLELQKLENQLQIQKDYGLSTIEIEDQIALKKKQIKDKEAKDEADLFAKRKSTMMEWMQITMDGLNALSALNEAFSRKDIDGQRKAFERDKKFKLASAITATALGVSQQLGVPKDQLTGMNFAKAAIVLATGIAQIKKISDTQFQGGTPPSMSLGGGSVPQPSAMATTTPTIGSTQLELDAQGNLKQQTVRTYVLETDISDKQKRSQRLQRTATLGK
jgi:hypothetical protein